jgi:acyl transferase domain-containing protein
VTDDAVAIIGMSGRFPGAPDLDAFWELLVAGREGITRFSRDELAAADVAPHLLDDPAYVPVSAPLDGPGLFDAEFFGFTPSEAELTDPQHRVFLECCWHALEDAGYPPGSSGARVGVFASTSTSGYRFERIARHPRAAQLAHPMQVTVGNDPDMLALRVSYKLNLTGPSVTVQTACSSSLVAVHLACQSLLLREADLALAGGAAVRLLDPAGYRYDEGGILSRDGHCRPFDAAATGTVSGDGAGVVVLKRLADALADGDHIRAVILGSAVNNDGGAKTGFTAPAPDGQAAVIAEALAVAGVDPGSVHYVEGHGTATPLGDPIEVRALAEAYRTGERSTPCLLGSVKANIGHLDTAAGIAGLIKTVLAVERRFIPPTPHFTTPNPEAAALVAGGLRVAAVGTPWPEGHPRAGVSAFGVGGTNVHLILEAAPSRPTPAPPHRPWQVLPLSARTPAALDQLTAALAGHLRANPDTPLADVAYTLQVGRRGFAHRRAVVCRDRDGAVAALEPPDRPAPATHREAAPPVVFLLPGQGSQYPGMGAELYRREPVFRAAVDECADLLRPHLDADVRQVAFDTGPEAARRLAATGYTQPAVFAVDYALARLLEHWGVRPAALLGHSLGELVAACLAGVLTLPDAVRVVAARARLMQALPPGRMISVALDEEALRALLAREAGRVGDACVAAVNAPGMCVVAGSAEETAEVERLLAARGVAVREVDTSHAFHSARVEPALPGLAETLRSVSLARPRLPMLSNVTGTWLTEGQATDPEYWVRHTRQPVRFADGVAATLVRHPDAVLVEVGPGRVLSRLAAACRAGAGGSAVVSLLRVDPTDEDGESRAVMTGLADLWRHGVEVDWAAVWGGERRGRVPLPTYPFQRRNHLLPRVSESDVTASARRDPQRWCWVPVWHRSPHVVPPAPAGTSTWLVYEDDRGLGGRLAGALRGLGHRVVTVRPHHEPDRPEPDVFLVDAARPDHARRLVEELRRDGLLPDQVVYAWSVRSTPPGADAVDRFRYAHDEFVGLVELVQALTDADPARPVRVDVLTDRLQEVAGDPVRAPERAMIAGAATVLPQEFSALTCRWLDVAVPDDPADQPGWTRLVELLAAELAQPQPDRVVAYRGARRWNRSFAPVDLPAAGDGAGWRAGAGYLVTGADGETGVTFAEQLVGAGARLVLVGQRLTDRVAALVDAHPDTVTFLPADLADPEQARPAVVAARDRLGRISGVVHAADARASGLTALKTRDQLTDVLAARVRSTLLLADLLADDDLDFFLLVSSTTGILGGFGQLENCAAAAFVDAFAHAGSAAGRRFHALDVAQWAWDDWHERHAASPQAREQFAQHRRVHGVAATDGVALAGRVVAGGLAQVVVSTVDFDRVLAEQATLTTSAFLSAAGARRRDGADAPDPGVDGGAPAGPDLVGGEAEADDEVVRTVAGIWREVLGQDRIGVDDDFFDLGGNSLFAIQIMSRLRQIYGDLPMSVIFEAATVRDLAAAVRARQAELVGLDEFEALLREVESLSPDEVAARLRAMPQTGRDRA